MAEKTGIAWTRSTFNPWIGCTEVSPGCDGCYARVLDARHRWGGATHWGAGVARMRTSEAYWLQPYRWNVKAEKEWKESLTWQGRVAFWPVFPSLCDPFDNEIPVEWRADFWRVARETPMLTWLLLTKRIGNAAKMLPADWGAGWRNMWLGASIVNQEEAERDLPKLLATPAKTRFVSYEPALGPIDFKPWLWASSTATCRQEPRQSLGLAAIDQIIVGGESSQGSHKARPFYAEWARSTVRQCRAAKVAVFVKQMGQFVVDRNDAGFDGCEPGSWPLRADGADPNVDHEIHGYQERHQGADCRIRLADRAGAEPAEWPEDLRVQEFPQ